jgi:hypothetical protein
MPGRKKMNKIVLAIFIFVGIIILATCNNFNFFQPIPTPTITLTPTISPTFTPTINSVEESNEITSENARELAVNLAGTNVIDCGNEQEDAFFDFGDEILDRFWKVNGCTVNAFQRNQAFRIHSTKTYVDFSDHIWIVGTSEGRITFVFYETGWRGGYGPEEALHCNGPVFTTLDEMIILSCGKKYNQEPLGYPKPSPKPSPSPDPSIPPSCQKIGQQWISPIDGMAMMCVPASKFIMGSDNGHDGYQFLHLFGGEERHILSLLSGVSRFC